MSINYVFQNPSVFGEKCPVCRKKSWEIFRCDKCGKIFCKYCHPEYVHVDTKTESMEITYECGSTALFIG